MNWKTYRRSTDATSTDGQIDYTILHNRSGQFYIKAYLAGGREHRLPFQNFATVDDAKNWVEAYEAERAERNARYKNEKPIRF